MNTVWKIWVADFVLIGLIAAALAQEKPAQSSSPSKLASAQEKSAATTPDLRVVGYIEKRDRTITIKAGPKGPVYSVKTAEGKVLFENVSAEQLRAQAPELHEFIKGAMAAGSGGKKREKTDARMDILSR